MSVGKIINELVLAKLGLKLIRTSVSEKEASTGSEGNSFVAQARILELASLLRPYRALEREKIRVGGQNDGGYISLDDFEGICKAFSFGIGADVSWDLDMAQRGILIYQFDHTVLAPDSFHPNFRFQRKRIVPSSPGEDEETLLSLSKQYLNHTEYSILKIDVEHDEWAIFDAAADEALKPFAQIICEFHGFSSVVDDIWFKRALAVLHKLRRQFAVVHVHGNNAISWTNIGNVPFPELLEVTFANRSQYSFQPSEELFPTTLDSPNDPSNPDLFLGNFVFSPFQAFQSRARRED